MKKLLLIVLILFASNATASSLPNCPSDVSENLYHNCFGTITFTNGDKFVGEWINGKRTGKGTYTWVSGSKYVGEWKDNNMHGQGTYTYSNGEK